MLVSQELLLLDNKKTGGKSMIRLKCANWYFNNQGAKKLACFVAGLAVARGNVLIGIVSLLIFMSWYYKVYKFYDLKRRK